MIAGLRCERITAAHRFVSASLNPQLAPWVEIEAEKDAERHVRLPAEGLHPIDPSVSVRGQQRSGQTTLRGSVVWHLPDSRPHRE
jgi:hypothetical protein